MKNSSAILLLMLSQVCRYSYALVISENLHVTSCFQLPLLREKSSRRWPDDLEQCWFLSSISSYLGTESDKQMSTKTQSSNFLRELWALNSAFPHARDRSLVNTSYSPLIWINLLDVALRWIDLTIYSIHSFLRVKRDSYLSELELLSSMELVLLSILEDPARIVRQARFNLLNLIHQ